MDNDSIDNVKRKKKLHLPERSKGYNRPLAVHYL